MPIPCVFSVRFHVDELDCFSEPRKRPMRRNVPTLDISATDCRFRTNPESQITAQSAHVNKIGINFRNGPIVQSDVSCPYALRAGRWNENLFHHAKKSSKRAMAYANFANVGKGTMPAWRVRQSRQIRRNVLLCGRSVD
jgi:hypothetical protein